MASAKDEAINYLGNEDNYINLIGFNKERDLANKIYETQRNAYQNEYDELLRTIANNRLNAKSDFSAGRGTIGENAYLKDRASATDLAARGLAGGVQELGRVGNRMETGRQYSKLANTYYRTMNEIDANERTGTNQYNTNMETEKNNLASTLADVDAREAGARNQYRATVAQLAEQIQARRAAEAAAAAARESLKQQIKQYQDEADRLLYEKLNTIAGEKPTYDSYEKAIKTYNTLRNGSRDDAINFLNRYGIQYLEPSITVKDKAGNNIVTNSPGNSIDFFSSPSKYDYYDEYGNKIK